MTVNGTLTWRSTFQPDGRRGDLDGMRAAFFDLRARLALASIQECEHMNRDAHVAAVGDELLALLGRRSEANFAVFDDPVFAIWMRYLHRAAANGEASEVRHHAASLCSVLERVEQRLTGRAPTYVPGTRIPVQQDDLDPYIKAATPPTYDFTANGKTHNGAPHGHAVRLQADLLGTALRAIGDAWPELASQVLEHVRVIGYLPDASFRSCSAARYSGVVYFGNMDESILDIEESIVHETGHQVLYRLAEVTPLTKPGTPQDPTFELPWSGSKRDFFGYLHAFYIYLLLVKYFHRRARAGGHEAEEARRRAQLILLGCILARGTLEGHPYLAEQGQLVMEGLCRDMDDLRDAMGIPVRN
jgi:hypothetical protein